MRSPRVELRHLRRVFSSGLHRCGFAPAILLTASLLAASAFAQDPAGPLPSQSAPPGAHVPFGRDQDYPPDQVGRRVQEEAAKRRNADRQARLVADTGKLLQLAQELKAAVDKSDKDTLSVSVVKKAEEIEKLAKSVKDRMRAE